MKLNSLNFTWYLVAAESSISKQSGVQDVRQDAELCRCLKIIKRLKTVPESKCSRIPVEMVSGSCSIRHSDLTIRYIISVAFQV